MLDEMAGAEPDVRREYQERLDIELEAPLDSTKRAEYERQMARQTTSAREQARRQEEWLEHATLEVPGGVYGA